MTVQQLRRHGDDTSWYANHLNNAIRLGMLLVLGVIAGIVYRFLLHDIVTGKSHFLAYVALWIFTAYLVLPRLYKVASRLYLPDYFFGRTFTSDGLLGDPINVAFNGDRDQLIMTMEKAGWAMAAPLSIQSSARMIYTSLGRRPYHNAPVSSLFLFGRKQDFAFEREIGGNPRRRHHIRFWKTPDNWWLPGGHEADWIAAATFDKNVGVSLFTGQVTHKIDANVDQERDFVISTLTKTNTVGEVRFVKHFTSSYHSRNGGGDVIHTDGALPFVTLKND
jgi:hypothetical protein